MAGDEIVIVERVDEGALEPFEFVRLCGDPGAVVGHRHGGRAERAHTVELGLRRGLDRDHGAGNAELPSRISDALAGVAGADRPDTFCALLVREPGDGVARAANLVGVGRLEVLELEPEIRSAVAELQLHQRRPQHGSGDPLPRLLDIVNRDRSYRIDHQLPLLLAANFF